MDELERQRAGLTAPGVHQGCPEGAGPTPSTTAGLHVTSHVDRGSSMCLRPLCSNSLFASQVVAEAHGSQGVVCPLYKGETEAEGTAGDPVATGSIAELLGRGADPLGWPDKA